MAYRDKIQIVFDIINCIKNNNNCVISEISRNANIEHYAANQKLKELIGLEIVTETLDMQRGNGRGKHRVFNLTDKGHKLHNYLEKLYQHLDEIGIKF